MYYSLKFPRISHSLCLFIELAESGEKVLKMFLQFFFFRFFLKIGYTYIFQC